MESWRLTYRDGFLPLYSTTELERLREALVNDDPRLTQGSTTTPPPLMCVQDWPCEAADLVGFPCVEWGGSTVGEVEEYFARKCFEADQRLGEPAACRWVLNYFDDAPRSEMLREFLSEVERELGIRAKEPDLDPALLSALVAEPQSWVLRQAVADWYRERDCDRMADFYSTLATTMRSGNGR